MTAVRLVGFCLAVFALSQGRPAGGAPNGTAVIAGRLVAEWPRLDATPRVVAKATIEAVATTWPSSVEAPFDEPVAPALATATSAADGTFRLEGLPAGRLGLIVRAPGVATTLIDGFFVEDGAKYRGYDFVCADKPREFASRVVRRDGGPVGGLEILAWDGHEDRPLFGRREAVRVKTAADGSYRVTGSVARPETALRVGASGYVDLQMRRWAQPPATVETGGDATLRLFATDAAGRAVAGARVRIVFGDAVREGRTSAEGRCEFAGVAAGGFALSAEAPGLAACPVFAAQPSPERPDAKFLAPLAEGVNERTIVLEKTCTLKGAVVSGADGRHVVDARVRYVTSISTVLGAPETTTDAAGRFVLRDLPRGGGLVVVDRDGWAQTARYDDEAWRFLGRADAGEIRTHDAVEGPTVFFADAGGSLDARFVVDLHPPLPLEVVDTAGRPVVGARWTTRPPEEGPLSSLFRSRFAPFLPVWSHAYADDSGRAAADLPPTGAALVVEAPGRLPMEVTIGPDQVRAARPVVLVMERYAAADLRVVDADSAPIVGAWIWTRPLRYPGRDEGLEARSDKELRAMVGDAPSSRTDEDGKRREWFPPGPVFIVVRRQGLLGAQTARVTVTEGGPTAYDVRIEPAGAVEGRVVRRGKPVERARVAVVERPRAASSPASPEESETADVDVAADGTFRVECASACRVAVVAYVASATDPDAVEAKSDPVEIDVAAGPATTLRVPLELRPAK